MDSSRRGSCVYFLQPISAHASPFARRRDASLRAPPLRRPGARPWHVLCALALTITRAARGGARSPSQSRLHRAYAGVASGRCDERAPAYGAAFRPLSATHTRLVPQQQHFTRDFEVTKRPALARRRRRGGQRFRCEKRDGAQRGGTSAARARHRAVRHLCTPASTRSSRRPSRAT